MLFVVKLKHGFQQLSETERSWVSAKRNRAKP